MVSVVLKLLQKVDVDVPKTRQLRDMLRFGVKLVTVAKTVNCWNEVLVCGFFVTPKFLCYLGHPTY